MNDPIVSTPSVTTIDPTPTLAPSRRERRRRTQAIAAAVAAGALVLGACGGSSGAASPATNSVPAAGSTVGAGSTPAAGSTAGEGQILPVTSDPINNTATARNLTIDSVLVENNVDETGTATDDHLEITLSNVGSTELSGFEVFYTFTDPTDNISESYYAQLPASFTIPGGGTRIAHFDNTGAVDHFPVNDFSLYKTSANAQEVTVEVAATDVATQTSTVTKDAGGAETAD